MGFDIRCPLLAINVLMLAMLFGCTDGKLPAGKAALMKLAEDDRLEIAVPAANELDARFGLDGVLELAESKDATGRGWAAVLLGRHDSKASSDALQKLLRDPDPEVKTKAIMAFAAICVTNCSEALDISSKDADSQVREAASQARAIVAARGK